jgi:hypothetical protein
MMYAVEMGSGAMIYMVCLKSFGTIIFIIFRDMPAT